MPEMSEPWIDYDGWDLDTPEPEPFEIDGVRLTMTCGACPEQYYVDLLDGTRIGYLRLRWSHFRADYPDCGGETVYEAQLDGDMVGCFSPEERKIHLPAAVKALLKRHNG